MSQKVKILKVNSSARRAQSYTRKLADQLIEQLGKNSTDVQVVDRDVSQGVEFVDEGWVTANFTPKGERDPTQHDKLALSQVLVDEVLDADVIVIAAPIYNFSVPASLKAWIDQIARANLTFKYTPNGPVGLVEGKKAYVVVASGGTMIGSEIDFATNYLKHVLAFIGITDVSVVAANQLMVDEALAVEQANEMIAAA